MKKVSKERMEDPVFEVGMLDRLARAGAARILMETMESEVVAYLGRLPYERNGKFRGYRNGYGKLRNWFPLFWRAGCSRTAFFKKKARR